MRSSCFTPGAGRGSLCPDFRNLLLRVALLWLLLPLLTGSAFSQIIIPEDPILRIAQGSADVEEGDTELITVYPNPFTEHVDIAFHSESTITWLELSPQRVDRLPYEVLDSGILRLYTSGLPSGDYYLILETEAGRQGFHIRKE